MIGGRLLKRRQGRKLIGAVSEAVSENVIREADAEQIVKIIKMAIIREVTRRENNENE